MIDPTFGPVAGAHPPATLPRTLNRPPEANALNLTPLYSDIPREGDRRCQLNSGNAFKHGGIAVNTRVALGCWSPMGHCSYHYAPGVAALASSRSSAIRFCSVRRLIPNISAASLRLPLT